MATTPIAGAGAGAWGTTAAGRRARGQALWGYALVAPMMLGFALFFLIALLAALAISLTDWNLLERPAWVGLENYARLFGDDAFLTSMRNTVLLTIPHVVLRIGIALALALALNSNIRFRGFYRAPYFLPVLAMPVAIGIV